MELEVIKENPESTEKSETTERPESPKEAQISFDSAQWLEEWNEINNNTSLEKKAKKSQLRGLLQKVNDLTERACLGESFRATEIVKNVKTDKIYSIAPESLGPNVRKTVLYTHSQLEQHFPKEKGSTKTTAHFMKSDILDVAVFIKTEVNKNPLVLVMGDPTNPGGEDHNALSGVEASLWRRTALREFIDPERRKKYFKEGEEDKDTFVYDIPVDGVVYCPNVPVFRAHIRKGLPFIPTENISFVIVPPVMHPTLEQGKLNEKDVETIRRKLEMVFLTALAHGHDAVIVTAFGCGYARNPPEQVVKIFSEVIGKFRSLIGNVAFAIIDDQMALKNNPQGNIASFSTVFDGLQKKK